MACAISGNSCTISASASSRLLSFNKFQLKRRQQSLQYNCLRVRASSDEADDCNTEECAPDKEVGKVSMEWVAGDKTRVVGTFPPRNKGWTGYVEKDTAGQTNIYSVEPAVYIAESAISSGSAGSSADGAENTIAIVAGLALVSIAAASSVLLLVGKNPPLVRTADYAGPSLSYYINKFTPPPTIEASAPTVTETSTPLQTETPVQEVSQPVVRVESQQETSPSSPSNVS